MNPLNKYNIYCATESEWKTKWSESALTQCPANSNHAIKLDSVFATIPSENHYFITNPQGTQPAVGQVVSIKSCGSLVVGFGFPERAEIANSASYITSCKMSDNNVLVAYIDKQTKIGYVKIIGVNQDKSLDISANFIFAEELDSKLKIVKITPTTFLIAWKNGQCVFGSITLAVPNAPSGQTVPNVPAIETVRRAYTQDANEDFDVIILGNNIIFAWCANGQVSLSSSTLGGDVITDKFIISDSICSAVRLQGVVDNKFLIAYGSYVNICSFSGGVPFPGLSPISFCANQSDLSDEIAIVPANEARFLFIYRRVADARGVCLLVNVANDSLSISSTVNMTNSINVKHMAGFQVAANILLISYITGIDDVRQLLVDVSGTNPNPIENSRTINKCFLSSIMATTLFNDHEAIIFHCYDSNACKASIYEYVSGNIIYYSKKGMNIIGVITSEEEDTYTIARKGAIGAFNNLQIGSIYYAHGNGSVSPSDSAIDSTYIPTRIGVGISATEILFD